MSGGGATAAELAAMHLALQLAATEGVPLAPNPRVGCVLLSPDGRQLAVGHHRGAGTPHAEVAAISAARAAGMQLRGATAVVTLEPCNHTGRTGPCTQALVGAGIARVVFGQADPNPLAAGGAQAMRQAGVEVIGAVLQPQALALNEAWTFAIGHGRPMVTWKAASTLDGRVAAPDGTSRWITGTAARREVHELRAQVQAVIVGTGTALADDPSLTVRDEDGRPAPQQPIRVVVGHREIPAGARLRDGAAPLLQVRHHDPAHVLAQLHAEQVQHALIEGGPTLAAAFLRAGLIDRVRWYVAAALLGAGPAAVSPFGVATISEILRLRVTGITRVGDDVRVDGTIEGHG